MILFSRIHNILNDFEINGTPYFTEWKFDGLVTRLFPALVRYIQSTTNTQQVIFITQNWAHTIKCALTRISTYQIFSTKCSINVSTVKILCYMVSPIGKLYPVGWETWGLSLVTMVTITLSMSTINTCLQFSNFTN